MGRRDGVASGQWPPQARIFGTIAGGEQDIGQSMSVRARLALMAYVLTADYCMF